MGLQRDLHATDGKATLMIGGRTYPVQVSDLTIRSGEPMEITAYVKETPVTTKYVKYNSFDHLVPAIKDVKFEDPATIVFWADGTKTVVRAQDEAYDPEKGLAMAISRKALGNKRDYYHVFLKWLKKFRKKDTVKLYTDGNVVIELEKEE